MQYIVRGHRLYHVKKILRKTKKKLHGTVVRVEGVLENLIIKKGDRVFSKRPRIW